MSDTASSVQVAGTRDLRAEKVRTGLPSAWGGGQSESESEADVWDGERAIWKVLEGGGWTWG